MRRVEGTIKEKLPNGRYKVEVEAGRVVTAYVPGMTRVQFVRVLPGDRVEVEVSPTDPDLARIVKRRP